MQPARLDDDVAEDEILKILVLGRRRNAARDVLRVDRGRAVARRVVEMERSKVRRLELDGDAAAALVVFEDARDK